MALIGDVSWCPLKCKEMFENTIYNLFNKQIKKHLAERWIFEPEDQNGIKIQGAK